MASEESKEAEIELSASAGDASIKADAVVAAADKDTLDKDEPRPGVKRASSSFYNSAKAAWVDRASSLIVRRPRAILAGVGLALLVACGSLVAVGFGVSPETPYDWDVQNEKYTKRLAMIDSAEDRTDREDVATRSDETYWWTFYYDTESYKGHDTCDAPQGLFTARNLRVICQTEQELLRRDYDKFCLAPRVDAGETCAPLKHSLAGFFYGESFEGLVASDCPLLADDAIDAVAARLYADPDAYGAYLDGGAFGTRGYACRGRSLYPLATPLKGFTKPGEYDSTTTQWKKIARRLRRVNNQLQKSFNMKVGVLLQSPLETDARAGAGGKKISVLWDSALVQQEEFEEALNMDFAFVIFSFLFVWAWIRIHIGNCLVATFSMFQILISLPLSMFVYRIIFQIPYFGPMQILVVFIILGIGADDVFVYSDAWRQSEDDVPRLGAESRSAWLERRVAYAYSRALEAILNTSFTTAVAFFATATSRIMPISTFGIFAAICVLMNYGLVMVCTPAVWILCTARDDPVEGEDATPRCRALPCAGACARLPSPKGFEKYVAAVRRKPVALALVLGSAAAGVVLATCASRLVPPSEPEEWFPPPHMITRTQKLDAGGKYLTNLAETYPDVSLYWGFDKLKRPDFSRYEPQKNRGDVRFSAPLQLHTTAAQDQILYACDELRSARGGKLVRPGSVVCFLEDFQAWHVTQYGADTYGLDASTFESRLATFRTTTTPNNDDNPTSSWEYLIGFVKGDLRYIRVAARLNARHDASVDRKSKFLEDVEDLVDDVKKTPGSDDLGNDVTDYSVTFVWYASQVALVDGLLFGLSLAMPVAFVVLCMATQNLILAFLAIITIGLIVASVLGTAFLLGWHLGIKESVAGVVVIGFSVDYTIHLGHMYDHARYDGVVGREDKFAYSIRKMGGTVLAGAITTAGSCSFLLACQLTFFTAMGTLIMLTVFFSLGYSLLFYMPLLRLAGPEGHTGDIMHYYRLACKRCKRCRRDG